MKVEAVVLDTNVLIGAAINRNGYPARCPEHVLRYGRPLFSRETFAELRSRLFLPRLGRYIGDEDREAYLRDLYFAAD